jgi:putative membrane protein
MPPAYPERYGSLMWLIVGTVLGGFAALLHVYIFVMESLRWTTPRVWRRFGVADQASAEITRPMAYNQGFYNLFLAVGAALGLVLLWVGGPGTAADVAGRALALFALACMAAAALVLVTTGAKYLTPALIQGTAPLLAFVALLFA